MALLEEVYKCEAWSPLADIINLSTAATFTIPGGYGAAIALPIQLVTGMYKELNGCKVQNASLQKMNAELFLPRGLYCIVVAHSNTAAERMTRKSIAVSTGTRLEVPTLLGDKFKTNFRNADGKFGLVEFPMSAELVFPSLDGVSDNNGQSVSKTSGFAPAMERTAKWGCIRKNPNTPLDTTRVLVTRPYNNQQTGRLAQLVRASY